MEMPENVLTRIHKKGRCKKTRLSFFASPFYYMLNVKNIYIVNLNKYILKVIFNLKIYKCKLSQKSDFLSLIKSLYKGYPPLCTKRVFPLIFPNSISLSKP